MPARALVATKDNAIGTATVRCMAHLASGKHVVEVDASHAVLISRPDPVADLVEMAARGAG